MQDSLNFPTTTTGNPLTPFPTPKSHQFPSLSRHKPPNFPILSSKTTTTTTTTAPLPPKPSKIPLLPSIPPPSNHTVSQKRNPINVISTTPDSEFQEKALFLDSVGLDSLSLLNSHHPSATIIAASLSDLKSLFEYLSSFGFSTPELRRLINMVPEILSLRLNDVVPVFTFLLREVKVPAPDIRRVICRRPWILVSKVESRLRPTLYFLQSIGIHEVNKHTNLLSSSVEDKFMPKIDYFEKIGFSYRDSVSMFRRFPPLFCYSVKDNFEPKFNYFVVEMGRELKELKEFPQYFSFSLERRIKPRHQSCIENGVYFPLPVMLKMKEEQFRERLDVCCSSSIPRSSSPLWSAKNIDVDTL